MRGENVPNRNALRKHETRYAMLNVRMLSRWYSVSYEISSREIFLKSD